MRECPNCKNSCDDKAVLCTKCKVIFDPNDSTRFTVPVKKKKGCLPAVVIVLALVILFAIIGSFNKKDEPTLGAASAASQKESESTVSKGAESKKEEKKTAFSIGETAILNDIETTFVSINESTGSDYNKPTDGNVFLLCEFTIANNSNSELNISSMLCFDGYIDDFSTSISFSASLEGNDKSSLDGAIAAGKKMNGVIGFEVTKDWKVAEIIFKPDVFSGSEITFTAKK